MVGPRRHASQRARPTRHPINNYKFIYIYLCIYLGSLLLFSTTFPSRSLNFFICFGHTIVPKTQPNTLERGVSSALRPFICCVVPFLVVGSCRHATQRSRRSTHHRITHDQDYFQFRFTTPVSNHYSIPVGLQVRIRVRVRG